MQYKGTYKKDVNDAITKAISNLESAKAIAEGITNIPGDFKSANGLRNVIAGIKSISLNDINSSIENAIKGLEEQEEKAEESALEFLNFGKKYEKMWEDLNRNTATTQKVANIQLKKEQDRIDKETKEVQERTQASVANGFVALYGGGRKLVENIQDFVISRNEQLEEKKLKQIYGSNKKSWEMYGEDVEEKIEQMRKDTMIYVEKDRTQEYMDKLYDENPDLQENDEKAYAPFKRTGAAYKIVEGSAIVAGSAVIMAVAPEAAPVVIPTLVGVNSAGAATEEYLQDKKYNSKEGITQTYENGKISKETYDVYNYIWNMDDEQYKRDVTDNSNLTEEEKETFDKIRNMNEEWTTSENLTKANAYGNAIGIVDALLTAGGMQLYKFNPFGNDLLNRGVRVAIDTVSAGAEVPTKALIRSSIDEDKDFEKAFEDMGGIEAVATSAIIGFGGSLLGEVIDASRTKKIQTDNIDWDKTTTEINNRLKLNQENEINIDVKNIDEIPIEFFERIDNPDKIFFIQDGEKISFSRAKYTLENMNNLKKEILLDVCDIEDEVLKAKALYNELNKRVYYDFSYNRGNQEIKNALINNVVSFDNMCDNKVICKGWSELYVELLEKEGINAKVVKANNANHWWVEIQLKDGRNIVADATEVIRVPGKRTYSDITSCKSGERTYGFFFIDEEQKGTRPNYIDKTAKLYDEINEIDKKLGYADELGYEIDKLNLSKETFKSKLYNKLFNPAETNTLKKETINILRNTEIPKNIDGYDLYGRYSMLNDAGKLYLDYRPDIMFYGNEPVCIIRIIDEKNKIAYAETYCKSLGRKQFYSTKGPNDFYYQSMKDLNDYILSNNFKPLK